MAKFHIYAFEKLDVYQLSLDLSVRIRKVVKLFPKEEQYELTRQLKRSVDSISSNLAEGSGRSSNYDQAHFTNIAYASGLESINHLNLASRLGFLEEENYTKLRAAIDKVLIKISALYRHQIRSTSSLKQITKEKKQ